MKSIRIAAGREDGFALVYMATILTGLLVFSGLAIDSGRAYLVKAQLTKAVDGAALAAARNLNLGDPRTEAVRIFRANFPPGYFGTSTAVDPTTQTSFFSSTVDVATGVNTVTVNASAVLPTTFMRFANFNNVTVASVGAATRRMVDLSLVLDVSSSIGWRWPYVRDAARAFVNSFDKNSDRISLTFFGNGASVLDQMPSSRGFNKTKVMADIPNTLPGGSTAMVQGLYRGWDELRAVPKGQQSGLRVIVLFTDGASNSVPAIWPGNSSSTGLRTWDFPNNSPDPDDQTHDSPHIDGLYRTNSYSSGANPSHSVTVPAADATTAPSGLGIDYMPTQASMSEHRSSGIPSTFPFQSSAITVNGVSQASRRGLRHFKPNPIDKYPATLYNINNAARNLVEIIANEARNDISGDYRIRIYTIGMGELVQYDLGMLREKSEEILKRIANDKTSPDFNDDQVEGRYYFARTPSDVGPAFQQLQSQILRLSK